MAPHDHPSADSRLQEAEIRLAFLERELDLYKDAVQSLHARLEHVEALLEKLRSAQDPDAPGGFPGHGTEEDGG